MKKIMETTLPKIKPLKTEHHEFKASMRDVLQAIVQNQEIENIKIADKILEPTFGFTFEQNPEVGNLLSQAISVTITRRNSQHGKNFAEAGRQKYAQIADEYAMQNYQKIQNLKNESGVSSYRDTIKLLTDKNIETPLKKSKWHIGTLQKLEARWIKLGLMNPRSKPKI